MHTVMDLLVTGLWWTLCELVARKAGIPDEFYWERRLEEQRKRR